jgi:hypothetical protein
MWKYIGLPAHIVYLPIDFHCNLKTPASCSQVSDFKVEYGNALMSFCLVRFISQVLIERYR